MSDFEVADPGTQRLIDKAKELLKVANCPNRDCHNQGWYAEQIGEDEYTQIQCQWCHERKELLDGK